MPCGPLPPVSGLPNELLVEIILYLKDSGLHSYLAPTHVCRHWRSVALASPILWTDIDTQRHPSLVDAFLQRSGLAGLHVSASSGTPSASANTEAILRANAARIARLYMCQSWTYSPLGGNLRDVHFHILEALEIQGEAVTGRNRADGLGAGHGSSLDFSRFTCLRFLSVRDTAFRWAPHIFPPLVRLELRHLRPRMTSMDLLLDILESMPTLEVLGISNCGPSSPLSHPMAVPHTVTLPDRLRQLDLGDELTHLSFFLSHVVIPTSTSLRINGIMPEYFYASHTPLVTSVIPLSRNTFPILAALRRVRLGLLRPGFQCDAYIKTEAADPADPPPFRLSFYGDGGDGVDAWRAIRGDFKDLFSSSPVTVFRLISQFYLDDDVFQSLLSLFPRLECIFIAVDDVDQFCATLDKSVAESQPLCPKLKVLTVVPMANSDPLHLFEVVVAALSNTLRVRDSHGMALEQLSLQVFGDLIRDKVEVMTELQTFVGAVSIEEPEGSPWDW